MLTDRLAATRPAGDWDPDAFIAVFDAGRVQTLVQERCAARRL